MKYKEIKGFSQYLIYENGDVFSLRAGKFLSPATNGRYRGVVLVSNLGERAYKKVHRLVADHFLPPPKKPGMIVNHIDGDRDNNHYTNLEWVTYSYNAKHAHKENLSKRAKTTTLTWPNGDVTHHHSIRAAANAANIHIMKLKRGLRKSDDGVVEINGFKFVVENHGTDTGVQPVVWRNLRNGTHGECGSIKEFTKNHNLTRHAVQERLSYPSRIVHGDGYQIQRKCDFLKWDDVDVSKLTTHFQRYDRLVKEKHARVFSGIKRVQIKWLKSGKIETFDSQLALHYHTNVNVTKISQKLATGKQLIIRTASNSFFLLRYESDKPWRVVENVYREYADENGSKAVKVTNVRTGHTDFYVSRGECGSVLGLDVSQMHTRLKNAGRIYGDYFFEHL